jgi:lactate racemase
MVGDRIFKATGPTSSTTTTPRTPDGMVELGKTDARRDRRDQQARGRERPDHLREPQPTCPWTAATSRSASGLAGYESLAAHHNPRTMPSRLPLLHGPGEVASSIRASTASAGSQLEKVDLPHRDDAQQPHVRPPLDFLMKNEDDYTTRRAKPCARSLFDPRQDPPGCSARSLHRVPGGLRRDGVFAGATEPTHDRTLAKCYEQYASRSRGRPTSSITGIPYISPVQRARVPEPAARPGDGAGATCYQPATATSRCSRRAAR